MSKIEHINKLTEITKEQAREIEKGYYKNKQQFI